MIDEVVSQLRNSLPESLENAHLVCGLPGLYSIEEDGQVIYVGLGRNLKKRIKQHRNFNPRSSMFAYRYMLDQLKRDEPSCSTKEKNRLRQQFKLAHPRERNEYRALAVKCQVRTAPLPVAVLRGIEHQVIECIKPKLNRCGT